MRILSLIVLFSFVGIANGKDVVSDKTGRTDVTLPGEDGKSPPVASPVFENRLNQFVWENWPCVTRERLAETVGTTPARLSALAVEMGLAAEPKLETEWPTKGYGTVLRRNWNLLNYPQILTLLGWSREKLAEYLLEDDYLYSKLGNLKPLCEPLVWSEKEAAAGADERRRIARILREEGVDASAAEEPRFDFIRELSKVPETPIRRAEGTSAFGTRLQFSYFADYADPLGDDEIGSLPEGLLARYAACGVNAVWLHVVLRTLAKDPFFTEFGEGSERRMANLRKLVARAKRHGIKVFLYLNEPRPMPNAFFEKNDAYLACRGTLEWRGMTCAMCTQSPEVRRWLRSAVASVFRAAPGLGGIFTITGSENLVHCLAHGNKKVYENDPSGYCKPERFCNRCNETGFAKTVADLNALLIAGMHDAAPDAQAFVWDWGWESASRMGALPIARELLPLLPKRNVSLMTISERGKPLSFGGVPAKVNEYSLSQVGPVDLAREEWALAKANGLGAVAKVQISSSWEMSIVPYVPVMDNLAQHAWNLTHAGVDHAMVSWTCGCYPSPNLRVFGDVRKEDKGPEDVLVRLSEELYGKAAAPSALRSWKTMSEGFAALPFNAATLHCGPHHWGPANPLYSRRTGARATMVGIPYDDLEHWRSIFPAEVYIDQMDKTAQGFARGAEQWLEVVAKTTGESRRLAERELGLIRTVALHYASVADQSRFVRARDAGDVAEMKAVARRELARAKELLPIVRADSRIGYECSCHYFYLPSDLIAKIVNCRRILTALGTASERPWLVVNEDNDHYFLLSSNLMNRASLERYVDNIAQGHVTHFFMCVNGQRTSYDSKTWEPIWEGLDDPARKDSATWKDGTHDRWAVHAKMLFDAGIDPYEVWTKRCREKGVSPWISMRMNDTHFATCSNYFRSARFVRNRRDLWRRPNGDPSKWGTVGLDYAQREAWLYALDQVREIANRWDSDGIELDWMRGFAQNLRPRHEREDAHYLTDFMRAARYEVNEAAKRHGHPMKLAVRVPRTWWTAKSLGLNVVDWAKEGLVDVVISVAGVHVDTNMPVDQWISVLAEANPNVMYLPTIDCVFAPVGNPQAQNMTIEHYRGVAETFYKKGAKGLYLFNAQYYGSIDGNRKDRAAFDIICAEGLAPETIATKPKITIDTYNDFPDWVWEGPTDVPPLMRTFGGKPVTTREEWETVRKPEIRERFLSQMYGKRPAAAEKPDVRFERAEPDRVMMDGKAVRKRIRCSYRGPYGESSFTFTAFIPKTAKPAPSFLLICNRDPKKNLDPERVVKSDFWPAEEIVSRGYAAISFFNGDVATDATWAFTDGVFGVYEKPYERTGESWGILSAWAWGASRVMDWIESEPTLDAKHVGVVGHSRGGKTALLTGVLDERFAMTCSNDSGCCGAKLNHMLMPGSEHFDQIIDAIGCWFCTNFRQYRLRDAEIDFDQHMLVALLAPRLVAIGSAVFDSWAGPEGEYYTGRFASPAWELYGRKGLVGDKFPRENNPLQEGCISYHERTGGHDLTAYDWARYLDFADRHGWR